MEPLQPSQLPAEADGRREDSGKAKRWTTGELRDRPLQDAVAAPLQNHPRSGRCGVGLGNALAGLQLDGYQSYPRMVDMFRAAGGCAEAGRYG